MSRVKRFLWLGFVLFFVAFWVLCFAGALVFVCMGANA